MIHMIYMAAGNGRRFGSNKLLALYKGRPLFSHGLDLLHDLAGREEDLTLTVVTRYEEILAYARERGITAVDCPESVNGVSNTIKAGIRTLEIKPEDYLLFAVADEPELSGKSLKQLLDAVRRKRPEVAALSYRKIPGNPRVYAAKFVPKLLELTGDEGGKKAVQGAKIRMIEVETAEELCDIDTIEDLQRETNQRRNAHEQGV